MPVFELELMETTMDRVRAVRATTSSPPEPESLPKRLCGTTALAGVTVQDAATLLALAQCTGWTADRIAHEFNQKKGLKLTAEEVWDIHKSWMATIKKEKRALELLDVAVMKTLLNKFGIIKIPYDTPLNETNRPISVEFAKSWSSSGNNVPLFPGFTLESLRQNKDYLKAITAPSKYGLMTPIEEGLYTQFGSIVSNAIKDSVQAWATNMWKQIQAAPPLEQISTRVHYRLVEHYACHFQKLYEKAFGKMGSDEKTIADGTVFLKSTGAVARFVLQLMLLDRMGLILGKREAERMVRVRNALIGFEDVDVSELPEDSKDCPVCLDRVGVENPEGVMEPAIKLVICCGQIIGRLCLKKWLHEVDRHNQFVNSCPMCRYDFTEEFVDKLFPGDEGLTREAGRVSRRHEREGAPAPEPFMATMPPADMPTPIPRELHANFAASFQSLSQAVRRP